MILKFTIKCTYLLNFRDLKIVKVSQIYYIYIYIHTHTHFKIMYLNALGWSVRSKHIAYIDEIKKNCG